MTTPSALRRVTGALCLLAACDSSSTTATGTPAATGIGVLGGSAQVISAAAPLPLPLIVHVTDQYGNSFPGATVTFTAGGGATLSATSVTSDANGQAQVTVTAGRTTGVDTVVAMVTGADVPARFYETVVAGQPNTFTIVSGNNQAAVTGVALVAPFVVQVRDTLGNPVVGDTVTWTAATGTLGNVVSVTGSDGTAQNTFTPAAGSNAITAAVNGTPLAVLLNATGN